MKLNLLIDNPNGMITGYLNIDPYASGSDFRVKSDITSLGQFIDDGECEEIRAIDILSKYEANKIDEIIDEWISKLRKNGILVISDIDLFEVILNIEKGKINLNSTNLILYGNQTEPQTYKKCVLSLHNIAEGLKLRGLFILEKSFNGLNFVVKAQRK